MRKISVLEVLYELTTIVSVREYGDRSPFRLSLSVGFTMLLTLLELLLCSVPDRRLELPTVVFDHDTRLHHETGARQQEYLLGLGLIRVSVSVRVSGNRVTSLSG